MAERPEETKAADYASGIPFPQPADPTLFHAPSVPEASHQPESAGPVGYEHPTIPMVKSGIEMGEAPAAGARPQPMIDPELQSGQEALLRQTADVLKRLSELEETNDRLREQDRAKAGFISMVVHDIRSPLTVIMGTLDLLNEDLREGRPLDQQHYQHLFRESLNNCQEIARLVEDMLELSRMRENRLRLEFVLTDCEALAIQALEIAAGAARQAGVSLQLEVQPHLPRVYVDCKQMHRALMNLVNNAIKFTPRGGQVSIRARILEERRHDAPCDYVLLSVADTGEGLSLEESPYIFDAYWQASNGKRKTGTGLGLAIVKRIAVAHGGNVSVRSTPGKGSTFTIMIPVRDHTPEVAIELAD